MSTGTAMIDAKFRKDMHCMLCDQYRQGDKGEHCISVRDPDGLICANRYQEVLERGTCPLGKFQEGKVSDG